MDSSTAQWSWRDLPDQTGQDEATQGQDTHDQFEQNTVKQDGLERDDRTEPRSGPETPHHAESNLRQRQAMKEESQEGARPDKTQAHQPEDNAQQSPPRQQRYGERTCRICFETMQPRWPNPTTGILGGYVGDGAKPVYISPDDPDLGRLISPCKCRGSQRYVHEGCLDSWRKQNPAGRVGGDNPNYFRCPTCHYGYRIGRIAWARQLQGRLAQVVLTATIFLMAIFLLGFFAEPIFSLWNDPVGTIADKVAGVVDDVEARAQPGKPPLGEDGDGSWGEHFIKGFLSLGIIGFAKYLLAMTPWQWWNIRSSGILGQGVRRGGGRARAENISWALVMIGAISFIASVWKVVRTLSIWLLKRAGDNVLDVGGDEEDEDETN